MNTNERERELVCLHPLGFKDSTKNTRFVFPQNGKEFLHTCLSLQKEDSALRRRRFQRRRRRQRRGGYVVVGDYSFSRWTPFWLKKVFVVFFVCLPNVCAFVVTACLCRRRRDDTEEQTRRTTTTTRTGSRSDALV